MNIVTENSLWWSLLALTAGLLYAGILYFNNQKLPFSKWLKYILFLTRALLVALIAFLLLGPFLKTSKRIVEQPLIIVAQDNSASIVLNQDSVFYREQYPVVLEQLIDDIGSTYKVEFYTFGHRPVKDGVLDYTDQRTDFSALFAEINQSFYRRNVGAVVILSDGINNTGVQADIAAASFPFSMYAVGLGDTMIHPDLSVTDVRYNRLIYNNSDFPVEVSFRAREAAGSRVWVQLLMDGQKIGEEFFSITSDHFSKTHVFNVQAFSTGRKKMTVLLSGLEDEKVSFNNRKEFYIDVLDSKQQVLMLAKAPHPDLAAIKAAVEDFYDLTVSFINDWKPDSKQYSLIILHQLPASGIDNSKLYTLLDAQPDVSILAIVGGQTDFNAFNRLQSGANLRWLNQGNTVDATPLTEAGFTLFTLEKIQRERLQRFPALVTPLAEYQLSAQFSPLLQQRVRGVSTMYPMLGFSEDASRKTGYIFGTGIWRWRLFDFNQNANHETFNDLIRKSVGYLMVKKDDRRLRIYTQPEFLVNEEVRLRAELYNPALELLNEPELRIKMNEGDKTYEFEFSKTENYYQLNAGRLPAGVYRYTAEATLGADPMRVEGEFVVVESTLEGADLQADYHLLRRLAKQNGGGFVDIKQMNELPILLKNNAQIVSTASYTKQYDPLTGWPWLLGFILLLAAIEWFLRKTYGSY